MLIDEQPEHVLEIGSLDGENTRNLLSARLGQEFNLTTISDDADPELGHHGARVMRGVSYLEIPKLDDDSIDFAIIDTDHNAWTFWQEIVVLDAKLKVGALVLIHDVQTFYYDTGIADWYADGTPYPEKEIKEMASRGSLGTAVLDFLSQYRSNYHLIRWLPEENGCAVIQKNPSEVALSLFQPGSERFGKRAGVSRV